MNFNKLLHTKYGQIMISIILGFGLASIFRKACTDRKCMTFKAPTVQKINDTKYKYNNKCFTFKENIVKCDKSKQIIDFE